MGSYGPLDVVDEPIEADSSVGYLNCSGMGLFGKGEVSNWFENPLDCSEMVPQLFDYNRFDADNPVVEKNLYLESNCLLSNSNGTILNQLDGFGNQTGNVAAGHSGIDVKGGVVSVPGEILETKYGDNGIEGERIWCLGSNEESYLGTSGFPVQGVGKPRLSSSMISLRSEDTQHKHHVDIFKEETVMDLQGLGEEKQDLLDGALCGFMSQPPNLDDIVGGAVNIDSACGIEVSDSLQLSHLSGIVGSRFSRQLVLDDQETDEASNFVEIMENLEQNVDITMASSSLIASPSESTEDNHRKDNNKNVIGLSEATVMAPQRNVEAGTSDSLMTETACGEENSSNLGGPVTIKENYVDSSQQLALDIEGISGASGLVDSIAQTDVEGKDNLNNCSSDVLSSTRRSTRQRKSNKMPETKKTAARCRQISKNMVSQGGKSGISLKIARRQRSLTSRQERSSVWGSLGNVMTVFTEYDVILKQDTELVNVKNQRPRKRSGVQGNKRSQKTHTGGKYLPLKENGSDLDNQSDRSIPKFKLRGNEVKGSPDGVLPVVFDSLACLPTVISECAAEPDSQIGSEILKSDDRLKLDKSVNHRAEYTHIRDLDKPVTYLGAGVLDSQHGDKDLESTLTQDTSVGNICSVGPLVSSQKETAELEEIIDKNYSEAGTSPDSEVINLIQDVDISASAVLTSSQVVIGPIESAAQNTEHMSTRKGKKHGKVKGTKDMSTEEKLLGCGIQNKTKKYTKNRLGEKVRRGSNTTDSSIIEITGKTSNSSSSVKKRPTESHLVSETGRLEKAWEVGAIIPNREISEEGVWTGSSELGTAEGSMKAGKTVVPMQNSKSRNKLSKRRSHAPDPARSRRRNTCDEKKKSVQKSVNKKKVNEKAFAGHAVYEEENNQVAHGDTNWFPETKNHSEPREHAELSKMNVAGHEIPDVPEKSRVCEITAAMISSGLDGQILPPRKAWVLCDDCQKWRCISATLADSIEETNCRWTCKDNADKAFANCSIPQEKTNAEINAELEISDASGEEDAHGARINSNKPEGNQLTVAQQAPWKPIVSNLFLHRNRKNQPIDEVMVCHCKRPLDGRLGCGDECLNRMLNIECVRGTCPCGDRCANQQFQKRKYAKLEHFRCGKKGYGLQLLESVTQGKFLIEYVGEVLDLNAYEARQKEYALRGQRHFYFMTLNGSEVIDACAKGNLGRFINHSCDPNCRTEKWMVNGEVCIGLFALRNIKQGEELTFDYNYVRVFGAAAKKCVCGSSQCRGYIGGDPSNTETIVQSDSDEEFPEPVMVNEGSEDCLGKTNIFTRTIGSVQVHHGDKVVKSPSSWKRLEFPLEAEDNIPRSDYAVRPSSVSGLLDCTIGRSASAIQPLVMASQTDASDESLFPLLPFEVSLQEEDIMSKTSSSIKSVSSPIMDTMSGSISNSTAINSKPRSSTDEDMPNIMKALPKTKSSRSSSSIKKGKCHSHPVAANKPQGLGNKPKKMLEAAVTNHLKGVEDKLNELLDADGGISKRKDSTKGYLKLLLVTAASDDNVKGEAVQSTRDLSIILDALLKTRSRIVLVDIVNKNGLQMLHNIMKQNRRNFNKIPIIRKLLKVLTFLAEKEILSLEHINSAPTCAGVESFKESIIQLTRHNDIKVHQIARSFRDKWIPRTSRRNLYLDRDDIKLELQGGVNYNRFSTSYNGWHDQGERPIDAMDCTTQDETSGSFTDQFSSQGHKSRKRKSRWDKPSEINRDQHLTAFMVDRKIKQRFECRAQPPELRQVTDQVAQANGEEMMCIDRAHSVSQPTEFSSSIGAQDIIDEAPPGFSSPLNSPWPSGDDILSTTSNHSLHTHYGKSAWEISMGCHQERYLPHLPVSYGIPLVFAEQLGTPQSETIDSWSVAPGIPFHPFPPLPTYPRDRSNILRLFAVASNEHGEQLQENNDVPCQGIRPPDVASTGASNQKMGAQMRCSSGSLGRRYFRQQKWNNWGKRPPWLRKGGNARQNSSRSQGRNVGLGILENEAGGSGGGENLSSTSYQRPHRHHDH